MAERQTFRTTPTMFSSTLSGQHPAERTLHSDFSHEVENAQCRYIKHGREEEKKKKITQYNQKNKLNIYLSLLVDSLSPHLEHIHFVFLFFLLPHLDCFDVFLSSLSYCGV